jgi:hypothetical protein
MSALLTVAKIAGEIMPAIIVLTFNVEPESENAILELL